MAKHPLYIVDPIPCLKPGDGGYCSIWQCDGTGCVPSAGPEARRALRCARLLPSLPLVVIACLTLIQLALKVISLLDMHSQCRLTLTEHIELTFYQQTETPGLELMRPVLLLIFVRTLVSTKIVLSLCRR